MAPKPEVLRLKLDFGRERAAGLTMLALGLLLGATLYFVDLPQHYLESKLTLAAAFMIVAGPIVAVMGHLRRGRHAVGLRLDEHGISGYFLPVPLLWDQIDSFGLVIHRRDQRRVGICLKDKSVLGEHVQAMLTPADPAETYKYHFALPNDGLKIDPPALKRLLEDWHERYRSRS